MNTQSEIVSKDIVSKLKFENELQLGIYSIKEEVLTSSTHIDIIKELNSLFQSLLIKIKKKIEEIFNKLQIIMNDENVDDFLSSLSNSNLKQGIFIKLKNMLLKTNNTEITIIILTEHRQWLTTLLKTELPFFTDYIKLQESHTHNLKIITKDYFNTHKQLQFQYIDKQDDYNHLLFCIQYKFLSHKNEDLTSEINKIIKFHNDCPDVSVGHEHNICEINKYNYNTLQKNLDLYLNSRKQATNSQYKNFYSPFFAFFSRLDPWAITPKTLKEKEDAVRILKQAINQLIGEPDPECFDPQKLRSHLATLRNGSLGDLLRSFVRDPNTNVIFNDETPPTTVSEFVEFLLKSVDNSISAAQKSAY